MLSSKEAFALIDKGEIKFVDVRFTDLRGVSQHFTVTGRDFTSESVEKGYGFDGSSIKGFQEIFNSDLIVKPDLDTLFVDPFFEKTLVVFGDIYDPTTGEAYPMDPRGVAKRAEAYLEKSGIGDVSYWGPELEFFVFDNLNFELTPYFSAIEINSEDLSEFGDGDGYRVRTKGGYFPVPPYDKLQAFRSEMVEILESLGIEIECHHHEVATAGQVEIDMRYDTLVRMADKVMIYKYVARQLAKNYGLSVSFLPKPIYGDNGSGMHTHQSIFKAGKNVFFDTKGYAELSRDALAYLAGVLDNLPSVLAFSNPTVNSYRRLVPHYEAPTAIAFSQRNRSAAFRVPMYTTGEEKSKRLELRCPDPTANPYLAFAAMLVFGIHGIKAKMEPTKMGFGPFDENIWEKKRVKQTPGNLMEPLGKLSKDNILAASGVFNQALIDSYVGVRMEEATASLLYPTPADFQFYGDI